MLSGTVNPRPCKVNINPHLRQVAHGMFNGLANLLRR